MKKGDSCDRSIEIRQMRDMFGRLRMSLDQQPYQSLNSEVPMYNNYKASDGDTTL